MKTKLYICSIFFSLFFLAGCGGQIPPLLTEGKPNTDIQEWQKYGAYYEYDEVLIEEEFDYDSGFYTSYTINQKLNILNRKGVDYGTVEIEKISDQIADFDIHLVGKDGKERKLNLEQIKEKYIASDTVIVPQVEPGCQITIKIRFTEASPMMNYEHWFRRSLPVALGRFSFFYSNESVYNSRAYHCAGEVAHPHFGGTAGLVLEQANILPADEVGISGNRIASEQYVFEQSPRILVCMKGFHITDYHYYGKTWEQLARGFRDYLFTPNYFYSASQVKSIVKNITKDATNSFSRADAILQYVQDNLSSANTRKQKDDPVDILEVLERKNGDYLEIGVVLAELYKAAGFETNVYVTRSNRFGGFDPDFPTWDQIEMPLVSVKIDGKEMIAYPYTKKMVLGEMPLAFQGSKGMSLSDGKIIDLPQSRYTRSTFLSEVVIPLDTSEEQKRWKVILGKNLALYSRHNLSEDSKKEVKDYWETIIREFSKDHEIVGDPQLVIDRGKDVEIDGAFQNEHLSVQQKNALYTSLGPFYRKYFTNLQEKRFYPYRNDRELVVEENVRLKIKDGKKYTVAFQCVEMDNALFQTQCRNKKTQGEWLLSRKLTVKKTIIDVDELPSYQNDTALLNQITQSYIVEN